MFDTPITNGLLAKGGCVGETNKGVLWVRYAHEDRIRGFIDRTLSSKGGGAN